MVSARPNSVGLDFIVPTDIEPGTGDTHSGMLDHQFAHLDEVILFAGDA
jgi:hypothetical protein